MARRASSRSASSPRSVRCSPRSVPPTRTCTALKGSLALCAQTPIVLLRVLRDPDDGDRRPADVHADGAVDRLASRWRWHVGADGLPAWRTVHLHRRLPGGADRPHDRVAVRDCSSRPCSARRGNGRLSLPSVLRSCAPRLRARDHGAVARPDRPQRDAEGRVGPGLRLRSIRGLDLVRRWVRSGSASCSITGRRGRCSS